jgi:uncharacterized protein (AIM24 family)
MPIVAIRLEIPDKVYVDAGSLQVMGQMQEFANYMKLLEYDTFYLSADTIKMNHVVVATKGTTEDTNGLR